MAIPAAGEESFNKNNRPRAANPNLDDPKYEPTSRKAQKPGHCQAFEPLNLTEPRTLCGYHHCFRQRRGPRPAAPGCGEHAQEQSNKTPKCTLRNIVGGGLADLLGFLADLRPGLLEVLVPLIYQITSILLAKIMV